MNVVSATRSLLSLALLVGLGQAALATDHTALSTSYAHVKDALGLAVNGDTVIVPAGTSTWTETLNITKNITFQGAGAASTIIINGISGGSTRPPLLSIAIGTGLPFRMTGFTFRGSTANTARTFNGEVRVNGGSHSFRIDHCTFDNPVGTNLTLEGYLWGVVDHCTFNTPGNLPIVVGHKGWDGKNWGHGSWVDDPHWGTEKFLFIEDNIINGGGRGFDANEGARFVVRYNQFDNSSVTLHGTAGQGRGAKQLEEYNNSYVWDSPGQPGQIRSGSIITFNNTFTKATKGHVLQEYRYFQESPGFGSADGENLWDKNVPNGGTGYWATGTHTGANGAYNLADSNANKIWWNSAGVEQAGAWSTNRWLESGACYMVRNKTREVLTNPSRSRTFAVANAATTITNSTLTRTGERVVFNTGDTYEIWKVSQSLDQPGMGKSDLLNGLGDWRTGVNRTTPYADPHQIQEPCYSWNNKEGASARPLLSTEPTIKENREFFNEKAPFTGSSGVGVGTLAQRPASATTLNVGWWATDNSTLYRWDGDSWETHYTPYTYPHPLVSGVPPPPPPPVTLPVNITPPSISGEELVGRTLSFNAGVWEQDDSAPESLSYGLDRCDSAGANCAQIATTGPYTLVGADDGNRLKLREIAVNSAGTTTATSALTDIVTTPAILPAPSLRMRPTHD